MYWWSSSGFPHGAPLICNLKALLLCSTGPAWYNIRSALNPKMLKLREVTSYAPIIHQVVGDLLRRIELLRSRSQDQNTVSDMAAELYKFGFEGVCCFI